MTRYRGYGKRCCSTQKGRDHQSTTVRRWSVVYDKRSATFHRDHVSLSTVNGRVECEYVIPDDPEETPIGEYLLNEDYEFWMSTLQSDRLTDSFYLHARTRRTTGINEQSTSSDAKHRTVLGVDLNVDGSLAVTSTGEFIGSADEMNHRRREFEKTRGSMQQTGTRSAHLSIQSMDDREHRWIQDELHRASNQILKEARDHGCTHIAFENLTDIRERMAGVKRFHAWAFQRLYEYVEYKTEMFDIEVEQVSPAYTSQRCSKCGFTHERNRESKHEFACQKCEYELNADYNATDILPGLKSWGSTVTDRAHDGEVPHSSETVGLWAVPVRPPTEIAGFIYRHDDVRILTSDSVAQPTKRTDMRVSVTVGFIPRLKSWALSLNHCKSIARKLLKRLRSGQKSSGGGAPCQCALTSGTLNLNGEFIASVDSTAEGESTDKPTTSVVGH